MKVSLQASPDFKGIKTVIEAPFDLLHERFKPALISKGLRLGSDFDHAPVRTASSQP